MKIFSKITQLSEFEKDFKKLKKRFRTLDSDLENFIKVQLQIFHKLKLDNQGIVEIAGLGIDYPKICKARKFACKALKGTGSNSGIRIIYAYYPDLDKIEFIEIYFKGDKESEDRERIGKHYGQ
jgi:aminoglycoside N3'-acetyltransferase